VQVPFWKRGSATDVELPAWLNEGGDKFAGMARTYRWTGAIAPSIIAASYTCSLARRSMQAPVHRMGHPFAGAYRAIPPAAARQPQEMQGGRGCARQPTCEQPTVQDPLSMSGSSHRIAPGEAGLFRSNDLAGNHTSTARTARAFSRHVEKNVS